MSDSKGLGPYTDQYEDELYETPKVEGPLNVSRETGNPPTLNQRGYIAWRGGEQHGVPFTKEMEGATRENHYAGEQQAFETYIDPTITPRDLGPVRPLAVELVESPDLLYMRKARATTYAFEASDVLWHPVLQEDRFRKRVLIRARTLGGFFIMAISPEQNPSDMTAFEVSSSGGVELMDSHYTGPLSVRVLGGDGQLRISVWTEYVAFNGERLMDNPYASKG